jgi:polyhydroxyalkanoic acid synthase PhaR subunit
LSEDWQKRSTDPMEVWRQWFEAGTKAWSGAMEGAQGGYADPYGLYRQWFEGLYDVGTRAAEAARSAEALGGSGVPMVPGGAGQVAGEAQMAETQRLWRQWFESTADSWRRAVGVGQEAAELAPRWAEALEKSRRNFVEAEGFPSDPLQFATRWYNATSGPFSEFVGEVLERDDLLDASAQSAKSYASFYKIFRRDAEEYLRALRLPVRSDIERVAGLVVNLEEKIDRIEESLEEMGDARAQSGDEADGVEERVGRLEKRLSGLEGKVDRILAALENAPRNGGSREATGAPGDGNGRVNATDAARRKAREMGVDLAGVKGTGSNGQITVDDVRRKGEEG